MPKKNDYPKSSFEKSLKLAEAVHALGGSCSSETAGTKLGLSGTSGGFSTLVGGAVKYNLIKVEKSILHTTELFKQIQLSYNDSEKIANLRLAFLTPETFKQLYEKLNGKELPISILDKILIKEYGVDEASASKVSKYFVSGTKLVKLLDDKNILLTIDENTPEVQIVDDLENDASKTSIEKTDFKKSKENSDENLITLTDRYLIQIIGPGLNTRLEINDIDDLAIVDITLNKIKKKLSNGVD
jgi:hypothetical protein